MEPTCCYNYYQYQYQYQYYIYILWQFVFAFVSLQKTHSRSLLPHGQMESTTREITQTCGHCENVLVVLVYTENPRLISCKLFQRPSVALQGGVEFTNQLFSYFTIDLVSFCFCFGGSCWLPFYVRNACMQERVRVPQEDVCGCVVVFVCLCVWVCLHM